MFDSSKTHIQRSIKKKEEEAKAFITLTEHAGDKYYAQLSQSCTKECQQRTKGGETSEKHSNGLGKKWIPCPCS